MQFKISSLKECDSSELKELMLACQPFVKVRDDADYWIFQRFFSSTSFIVRSNGKLVGALTSWGDPEKSTDIYIEEVAVHPECRNQGIFNMLFENLEAVAKERGFKRLWLTCNPVNPAIQIWGKIGFTNIKTGQSEHGWEIVKNLKGPGLDRAVFEKQI